MQREDRRNSCSGYSRFRAGAAILALLLAAGTASAQALLGTAAAFGVLGGSTVTNTGSTIVAGNVGVYPGSALVGFPPGSVVVPGVFHASDAIAQQAQVELVTAYNTLQNLPSQIDLTGQNLGGLTLGPAVYSFTSSAQLTGTLTLDAQGNPDAVFVFQIGSTLTTASNSAVLLINAASACNVFWAAGSSATLGTNTLFAGNVLALTSITMNTGSFLMGRALAINGAVTLDNNVVSLCAPAPPVCPTITLSPLVLPGAVVGVAYNQSIAAAGGTGPYSIVITAGALPPGMVLDSATGAITGTPTAAGVFSATMTATDADSCTGGSLYAFAVGAPVDVPAAVIPTLSAWGLSMLMALAALVAAGYLRRR